MSARRSSGDLRLHCLAPGVFCYRHFFSNSAVFATGEGVVVVDTGVSPRAGARLAAAIARATPQPVTHVVNTHYHGDHCGGNAAFPGAPIFASEDTSRLVAERDGERVDYARTFGLLFEEVHPIVPPTRTFRGRLELAAGGERFELLQIGQVETPDACIVHWPARGAVACGDGVATWDYPYLGVPFLDEGLKDDGEWLGHLARLRALEPRLLVPGHGPPLRGRRRIRARLDLLAALFRDLFAVVREELAAGGSLTEVAGRADRRLRRYRERRDLAETVTGQRFAIYRALNGLLPERRGRGWWHDLRPSVINPDDAQAMAMQLDGSDAAALARLAQRFFERTRRLRPRVDATEYLAAAVRLAERARAIDEDEPVARLVLACARVFGGMVLAQPLAAPIAALAALLDDDRLAPAQRRLASFFLGKAHQMEGRERAADHALARALPPGLRCGFPLLRARLRALP